MDSTLERRMRSGGLWVHECQIWEKWSGSLGLAVTWYRNTRFISLSTQRESLKSKIQRMGRFFQHITRVACHLPLAGSDDQFLLKTNIKFFPYTMCSAHRHVEQSLLSRDSALSAWSTRPWAAQRPPLEGREGPSWRLTMTPFVYHPGFLTRQRSAQSEEQKIGFTWMCCWKSTIGAKFTSIYSGSVSANLAYYMQLKWVD